jgi:FKBP-type peptidyl-prolyl cis-trans isomerase SlyD
MSDRTESKSEIMDNAEAGASGLKSAGSVVSNTIATNKVVSFHYRLSSVDAAGNRGNVLEESFDGDPLHYLHGFHNVIVGLERALEGKQEGDAIDIVLQAEDAYGHRRPDAVRRVPIKHVRPPKGAKSLAPGMIAAVQTEEGTQRVLIIKVGKYNADIDFNHPYAGRALHYEVKVAGVRDASAEEISHGHVHTSASHQQ